MSKSGAFLATLLHEFWMLHHETFQLSWTDEKAHCVAQRVLDQIIITVMNVYCRQ